MKKFFIVCVLLMLITISSVAEVKVFTHIEANGTSFNPGDSFSVYVVPVNHSSKYLSNLQVNLSLPENIMLTKTILPKNPDKLEPYESKVFEYVVRNTNPLKTSLPVTGDRGLPIFCWILLGGIAIVIISTFAARY